MVINGREGRLHLGWWTSPIVTRVHTSVKCGRTICPITGLYKGQDGTKIEQENVTHQELITHKCIFPGITVGGDREDNQCTMIEKQVDKCIWYMNRYMDEDGNRDKRIW